MSAIFSVLSNSPFTVIFPFDRLLFI